jgi:hypothetical protein
MARPISRVDITPEERAALRKTVASPTAAQRDVLRARIVLLQAEGHREIDVAQEVGTTINTVSLWSRRFDRQGLDELVDAPGRGRKPSLFPAEFLEPFIEQPLREGVFVAARLVRTGDILDKCAGSRLTLRKGGRRAASKLGHALARGEPHGEQGRLYQRMGDKRSVFFGTMP